VGGVEGVGVVGRVGGEGVRVEVGEGLVSAEMTAPVRRVPRKIAPPPANHCQFP
jgi:hypothetical protein